MVPSGDLRGPRSQPARYKSRPRTSCSLLDSWARSSPTSSSRGEPDRPKSTSSSSSSSAALRDLFPEFSVSFDFSSWFSRSIDAVFCGRRCRGEELEGGGRWYVRRPNDTPMEMGTRYIWYDFENWKISKNLLKIRIQIFLFRVEKYRDWT